MASSDDEGEPVPTSVDSYEFSIGKDEPISFSKLPVQWNTGDTLDWTEKKIFLRGTIDNGLQKIYKQLVAWKFDLSCLKPEISVLTKENHWIKLLKPRKAFESVIRSILVTVQCLHFVKRNPESPEKAMWDNMGKVFSLFDPRPSVNDLVDHISLIDEAVKRDGSLSKSKVLLKFLEEKPRKRKALDEDLGAAAKPSFIVDDDTAGDDEEEESEDEDDCFDSVCAICDNGGTIFCCEGKCMRSFHPTVEDGLESACASLGLTKAEKRAMENPNVDFYCKNCEYKQHQCFACGKLGSSDESSGAEVFRCVNGACGHFYHPLCVAKLLHNGDEAAAEEHSKRIAAGEQFACPVHRCYRCKDLEVKSDPELQFAICRRCPRAYHRKCLPKKIAFEVDADEDQGIVQRAWEGLIPNRILIYCLKHEIDLELATPVRNHIKFPGSEQKSDAKRTVEAANKKKPFTAKRTALEDTYGKKDAPKPSKPAGELFPAVKQGDPSKKRLEKLPTERPLKKRKVALNKSKSDKFTTGEGGMSLGKKLYSAFYGNDTDSEPDKSSVRARVDGDQDTRKINSMAKEIDDSVTLDDDTKNSIIAIMNEASSSITLENVEEKLKAPSTHVYSTKNVTLGKIEGSIQAVRAALRKLEEGGSIQDAQAVCGRDLLIQVMKWKEKLKVYLAPFLYGNRYTSYGRHFTSPDKLEEIVDMLHWYVRDGDTIVDFCCGSNDFSCFMKKKLDEMGKHCSFKNYDIVQAKNDFCFEKRDWMEVQTNELPEGSRLIMGLNPPFGINGNLANKFIDKALKFKPKLLILIVPEETRRLDEKKNPYNLVWQDNQLLAGNAFYLPGSIDVNGKQLEDWNVKAPPLYLWSHPDWTSNHKSIAEQHGHPSMGRNKSQLENNQNEIPIADSAEEQRSLDQSVTNQVNQSNSDNKEPQREQARVSPIHKEELALDRTGNEGNKNQSHGKNQSRENFKENHCKKRKGGESNKKAVEDKHSGRRYRHCDPSPRKDGNSSVNSFPLKHTERKSPADVEMENVMADYQHPEKRSSSASFPSSYRERGGNREDDLVRKYLPPSSEPCDPYSALTDERQQHTPLPEYRFKPAGDQYMGYQSESRESLAYRSYMNEMEVHLRPNIPPDVRQDLESWRHRPEYLSDLAPRFPSSYAQLGSAANPSYGGMGTSAMQRYAPRLDKSNHPRMNYMGPGAPLPGTSGIYQPPVPRPGYHTGPMNFAPGHYRPFLPNNSSGWIGD